MESTAFIPAKFAQW